MWLLTWGRVVLLEKKCGVEGGRRQRFRDLVLEENFHFVDCCV